MKQEAKKRGRSCRKEEEEAPSMATKRAVKRARGHLVFEGDEELTLLASGRVDHLPAPQPTINTPPPDSEYAENGFAIKDVNTSFLLHLREERQLSPTASKEEVALHITPMLERDVELINETRRAYNREGKNRTKKKLAFWGQVKGQIFRHVREKWEAVMEAPAKSKEEDNKPVVVAKPTQHVQVLLRHERYLEIHLGKEEELSFDEKLFEEWVPVQDEKQSNQVIRIRTKEALFEGKKGTLNFDSELIVSSKGGEKKRCYQCSFIVRNTDYKTTKVVELVEDEDSFEPDDSFKPAVAWFEVNNFDFADMMMASNLC